MAPITFDSRHEKYRSLHIVVTNITQYYFQVNEQNLHDLNVLAQVVNHYDTVILVMLRISPYLIRMRENTDQDTTPNTDTF